MKTLLAVAVLFVSGVAVASCPKGTIEFSGGCAEMPSPSESTLAPMVATSNEKPSRHPEAAWQRGEVNAVNPPSLAAQDAKMDQDNAAAVAEGRAKAGIK